MWLIKRSKVVFYYYSGKFNSKYNFCRKIYKSSHQRCSVRKGVLRNFAKFTGKQLCQSLWERCFPVNFAKFLRTTFLQNTSRRLLLNIGSVFRRIKDSVFILMKYYIFNTIPLPNIHLHTICTCLHLNILIYTFTGQKCFQVLLQKNVSMGLASHVSKFFFLK